MKMYSLNLDNDNRILSACICLEGFEYDNKVESLPEGNIIDYRYINGSYIHDPLPEPDAVVEEPTQLDKIEAQVLYTAMETNTLLETEV